MNRNLKLQLRCDAEAHGNATRLRVRLDAAALGQKLSLTLPAVDVSATNTPDGSGAVVTLPVLYGQF